MTADAIRSHFPLFVSVVGDKWLRQNAWCNEDYISSRLKHYEQLEKDLKTLETLVGLQKLRKTHHAHLRDQNSFWSTLHEIHGISFVGNIASSLELKVPLGKSCNKDFDAKACILGTSVNIECKTRKDEFPFKFPPIMTGPHKIPVYSGSRATLDPHDAEQLGLPREAERPDTSHVPIPEATEVRRILLDGLSQLPNTGINLIVFGQITGGLENLETALFGPVVVDFWKGPNTSHANSSVSQLPHGAFDAGPNGEPFRQLSAVLWFKLFSALGREYKLYLNPNATSPLPQEVVTSLLNVMGQTARTS